jgi:hypothetical protein
MGKFEKGHKFATGRPKGSLNKKNISFRETLEAKGYDVAEALYDIYIKGLDVFNNGNPDDRVSGLKIAGDMAKEIASYVMPKLKAIEVTKSSALDNMSPQEKLEAMKQAVRLLEADLNQEVEIKQVESSSDGRANGC